jgi:hypothetical protein
MLDPNMYKSSNRTAEKNTAGPPENAMNPSRGLTKTASIITVAINPKLRMARTRLDLRLFRKGRGAAVTTPVSWHLKFSMRRRQTGQVVCLLHHVSMHSLQNVCLAE